MSEPRENIYNKMKDILNLVPSKFYADILYDSSSNLKISKSLSGESIIANLKNRGYVFRVFDGRKYHEIATPSSEYELLKIRVEKLVPTLNFYSDISLVEYPTQKINSEFNSERFKDFTMVPIEEKQSRIYDIFLQMKNFSPEVLNPSIYYADCLIERIFVNSEGSLLRQKIPRVSVELKPIVRVNNKIDFDLYRIYGEGGYEIFENINQNDIQNIVNSSIELAQAPLPPHGKITSILDPAVAGGVAHGVFGHGLQADQIIRGRSFWKQFYKKRVASEIVNISDSALNPKLPGSYLFDDEGVIPQKSKLVENGILKHYLHSRLSASILKMEDQLMGNGRRQDFLHPLYPRNSNTYFEPGDSSLNEMIEDISAGVLIQKVDFGMEDPIRGGIQFNCHTGFLIENGEKTQRVKGISLSGDALSLLNSIDAVSKGPKDFQGFLSRKGREDIIPISFGGVYVRVKDALIGPN